MENKHGEEVVNKIDIDVSANFYIFVVQTFEQKTCIKHWTDAVWD